MIKNPKHFEWDQRYMRAAKIVASWSKDPSTKCGAVIVRPDKTIASAGFNGFPRGMADDIQRYEDRSFKYPHIIHSEWNALMSSNDETLHGCSVYAWPMPPCHECTGFLLQKKISRIVCPIPTEDKLERWKDSFIYARSISNKKDIVYEEQKMFDDDIRFIEVKEQYPDLKWVERFLTLAYEVHLWSKDKSNPRGAVIVRPDKTISSLGFNGFAQGVDDTPLIVKDDIDQIKMGLIPAEINALLFSQDTHLDGFTVYSWPSAPPLRSVVHLIHQGVKNFVFPQTDNYDDYEKIKAVIDEVGGSILNVTIKS